MPGTTTLVGGVIGPAASTGGRGGGGKGGGRKEGGGKGGGGVAGMVTLAKERAVKRGRGEGGKSKLRTKLRPKLRVQTQPREAASS